jgi:catechol 2,3-dioxygenase-like lactoylglutathione lyase family enzyme
LKNRYFASFLALHPLAILYQQKLFIMKQYSPSPAAGVAAPGLAKKAAIAPVRTTAANAPFTLDQLTAVANRYAPIVMFHPDEKYFMCTVDWYLQRGTLLGPDGYIKQSPTVDDLPTGKTDDGNYWLEMTDEAKAGDLSIARTYLRAYWETGDDYTDLQYWFCYGYNGPGTLYAHTPVTNANINLAPLGEHWIDWEQMTVRVNNQTQEVLGVFLSQHGEGVWITDLTTIQRKNDQFIIYASNNGHALYAQTGINPTHSFDAGVLTIYLRNDTANGGVTFDSSGKLDIVSADFIPGLTEPKWLQFPYRWGLGSDSHLSLDAIAQMLVVIFGPFSWITYIPGVDVIGGVALLILPFIKFDDTNGVYGPQTQSYWTSQLIPKFRINVGYTGWNSDPDAAPSIISFAGIYHIFFRDHGGNGVMHVTSTDGITWSRPDSFYTGVNGSSGPCAVVYQDVLHVFFRDGNGNGILYIQSTDGKTFKPAPNWYIGLNCDGQPSATVLNGKLCLAAVGHGGTTIFWAVQTGLNGKWTNGSTGWNVRPGTPPFVVAWNNLCHLFFTDNVSKSIKHLTSPDGAQWMPAQPFDTGFEASSGPAAIPFDGMLYLFLRDPSGNGILYIQSTDGNTWTQAPNWYIGLNCDIDPRIAISPDNTGLCLASIDAGGNGIMRAVFQPW